MRKSFNIFARKKHQNLVPAWDFSSVTKIWAELLLHFDDGLALRWGAMEKTLRARRSNTIRGHRCDRPPHRQRSHAGHKILLDEAAGAEDGIDLAAPVSEAWKPHSRSDDISRGSISR
jgi:hypothetical protein